MRGGAAGRCVCCPHLHAGGFVRGTRPGARWRLFIDESGSFDDPDQDVLSAGLLIRADTPGSSPAEIRHALQGAAPDLPWPLHASVLNRPVIFALAAHARRQRTPAKTGGFPEPRDHAFDELADRTVTLLAATLPAEVAHLLDALGAGGRIDWSQLRRVDSHLRAAEPATYERLASKVRSAWWIVGRLIAQLAEAAQGAGDEDSGVLVVSCGETCNGDAAPAADSAAAWGSRRYFALLACLLRRTVDMLERRPGRHEVRLQVLSRPIIDPLLQKKVQLHIRHVGDIVRSAVHGSGERVRIVPERVPFFNEGTDATLVLADFVANRCLPFLRPATVPLAAVEERLSRNLNAILRSGTPPLSHLAATGRAQVHIDSARLGAQDPVDLDAPGLRRWACDQARQWGDFFAGKQ